MNETSREAIFEFGSFRADLLTRRLYHDGIPVSLSSKAFDTLTVLVKNCGQTLSREMLVSAVWDDTVVADNNLNQQISALRKALGEDQGNQKFIATVSGKGYSFVAPVRRLSTEDIKVKGKDFGSRFQTIDRGRRIGFALALLYIFAFCSPFFYNAIINAVAGNRTQSLAVFQFKADRGDEFLGQGISETLRARLGSVADLTVRPGSAAINENDVMTAGRELDVDAIVTGSVQRAENRVRITVEMIDIDDGRVVWGKTFDDEMTNIFALQDSIVGEVASVLSVRLTSAVRDRSINAFSSYAS